MSAVTPRKRKTTGAELGSRSGSRSKAKGPPTLNPPLVPFPTPPATRHRKDKSPGIPAQPSFSVDSTPPSTPTKRPSTTSHLPPHLQTLVTLNHALNLALSLHIATHPPVLPPHPPSATSIDLPNLTNYVSIKEIVERTSGRRFGLAELGRLAWLWEWDGRELPNDKIVSEKNKGIHDDDNPFLVKSDHPSTSMIQVGGLSYLITPTRTLDPLTGRKVHTFGLGIALDLKRGETRQVLPGGGDGGLGNAGQGGGTGAIGRWNAGGESREDTVRERLERWVELNGGYVPPHPSMPLLPTPSTSSSSRSTIPPIPILPLPHLPQSTLLPSAKLFASSPKLDSSPGLTSLHKPIASLGDPFVLDEDKLDKGKVIRTGSVEERRQAMMNRIKARKGTSATIGSSVGIDKLRPTQSIAEQHEALKRRSTLSRLEGIAEGVWMMFSAPSPGPSTLPTPPRGRRKAIPMSEVADVIVKSSKTPISTAEARTSLQMLATLCPFFLTIKTVAKQEWLEMPSTLISTTTTPPSPSSSSALATITGLLSPRASVSITSTVSYASTRTSPRVGVGSDSPSRTSRAEDINSSPTPGSKRTVMQPFPPSSPTPRPKELAGPASPGRVRRIGGLREVRERIRRELGE